MNPILRKTAKVLGMDSARAANYLGKGSKNAMRLNQKAVARVAKARSLGVTSATLTNHNMAIRMRQAQLGMGYGGAAVGVGVIGSQAKNRSSYNPARPMTQAPSGTGRYA